MGLFKNRVELIGNLGRDPEIRATQNGSTIATLSIATTESWKDKNSGEWRDKTEWHRVVIFNDSLAKIAEKHLSTGMKVHLEGKLRTHKWVDKDGNERYSTEVHLENFDGSLNFDLKKDPERTEPAKRERAPATAGGPSWDAPKGGNDLDDPDIPF